MSQPYMPSPNDYLNSIGEQPQKSSGGRNRSAKPIKPTRSWRRIFVRVLKYSFITLAVLVVISFTFIWYNLSKLSVNPLDLRSLSSTNDRTNILVLGIGDPGHDGQNLSDTMIVLSLNHATNQVAMISVPRDLGVDIPGYGYSKINAANAYGGPALAEKVVADTLGIPINYYIKTDFTGLEQAVDAVGGINVTVTSELVDPEYPCASNQNVACGLDIQPGTYHMDGALALEYVRCRKGTCGNDFGRAARQQQVIQKLRDKLFTPAVFLNLKTDNTLINILHSNVQTNLSPSNLLEVAWDMKHASRTITFVYSTAPGGLLVNSPDSTDLLPADGTFEAMQSLAQNIFTNPPSQTSSP